MKIKDVIKNITRGPDAKYDKLDTEYKKLQALVTGLLTRDSDSDTFKGNEYSTYTIAVAAIDEKYKGLADWGVLQTGNIIDLRAAFVIGEGLVYSKKPGVDANAELEWMDKFFKDNDFDNEMVQEYAKEAEIEGKIAIKLTEEKYKDAEDKDAFRITALFISWTDKKYKVETDPQNYTRYTKLNWKPKNKNKGETLNEKDFVYKKFGGRIHNPNEAAPKIMKCLTQIDNLDKALRDWREINRLFAAPIPNLEVADSAEAKKAQALFKDVNWKIKKMFIHGGKFSFASPDIKGVQSLENEIISLAKVISGTTGIPVHFIGFPDLMSNRSTSTDLVGLIVTSTQKERETWKGVYEELITKGMEMTNATVNKGMSEGRKLDPSKIQIDIPIITNEHYEHIEKIYLPAAVAGKISTEAFLEKLPGVDLEQEMERKANLEESELEQVKRENADIKTDLAGKELFGEGEE